MTQGGYRPGAGRPKGTKNKRKQLLAEGARVADEYGVAPLDYLLTVMMDETQPMIMLLYAAKAALPFCHPRLSVVHEAGNHDSMSHEDARAGGNGHPRPDEMNAEADRNGHLRPEVLATPGGSAAATTRK